MATNIRPEVSEKNPYYIPRERYYELKHFCRQYPIWKKAYNSLDGLSKRPADLKLFEKPNQISDPTERCAESMVNLSRKIEMVERCARQADPTLYYYIMRYVTYGEGYIVLKTKYNIPCCKDIFYTTLRKFFWLLSKERD